MKLETMQALALAMLWAGMAQDSKKPASDRMAGGNDACGDDVQLFGDAKRIADDEKLFGQPAIDLDGP